MIILASGSPRRRELMKQITNDYKVITSDIDEEKSYNLPPLEAVLDIAKRKGEKVHQEYPNDIVISADTIVVLNGKIVGKPKNKEHSIQILKELNGSLHKVYTGVTILSDNKKFVFYDVAKVKMQKLSDDKLKTLFGKHMDKAGAYAVQDKDDCFVKKIYGDYYTVVGMPYIKLKKELKKFKIYLK